MRKALAFLLMAVLAIVPCAGMNASQALASDQNPTAAHVDNGHIDNGQPHAHGQKDGTYDQGHDGDPTDCFLKCDSTAAQTTKSEELNTVVSTFVIVTVAYYVELASGHFAAAVPGFANEPPPWSSIASIMQPMTVLDRTTRLRN